MKYFTADLRKIDHEKRYVKHFPTPESMKLILTGTPGGNFFLASDDGFCRDPVSLFDHPRGVSVFGHAHFSLDKRPWVAGQAVNAACRYLSSRCANYAKTRTCTPSWKVRGRPEARGSLLMSQPSRLYHRLPAGTRKTDIVVGIFPSIVLANTLRELSRSTHATGGRMRPFRLPVLLFP